MIGKAITGAATLTIGMVIIDPLRIVLSATVLAKARKNPALAGMFTVDQVEFDAHIDYIAEEIKRVRSECSA